MQFAFSAMLFSSSSMHRTSAEDSARETPEKFPKDAMRGKFKAPIWWLATLLLRCDTDNLPGVFGLLRETRLLVGIVADAAVKDIAGIAELEKDSAYLLCPDKTPPADELKSCRIGFILPHGGDMQTWARTDVDSVWKPQERLFCSMGSAFLGCG